MSVPVLTPRSAREQRSFRALLDASARPGSVGRAPLHPQGGRLAAAVALIESVLDHEVTFTVVPTQADAIDLLLRLTGSRVAALGEADYLLAEGDGVLQALREAKAGTPEFPDRSATLFATVERVAAEGDGAPLRLAGPGIKETAIVHVAGLPVGWADLFEERSADVPMGVDLVLVAPDGAFTCLPRYTRLVSE